MNGKIKLFVAILVYAIIDGWVGTWWIGVFSRGLNNEVFALNDIVMSGIGVISIYYTVVKYAKPSLKVLVVTNAVSYLVLPTIVIIGPEAYLITSGIYGSLCAGVSQCFQSELMASNFNSKERKKLDDTASIVEKIGTIVGSSVFLLIKRCPQYGYFWGCM